MDLVVAKKTPDQRIEPRFDTPSGGHKTHSRKPGQKKPSGGKRSGPARKKHRSWGGWFQKARSLAYWCFVLALWGGIGVTGIIGFYAVQLPQSSSWAVPQRPPNVKILSVNGKLVANRGITGGEAVRLSQMSPYIPQALVAIEDRRFRSHFGVDLIGLLRASVKNLIAGRIVEGGSTITQQLAKNLFLKPARTFRRKVQEVILSFWLETKFSKDEILEIYLNRVYFGSGSYGVDAASRRYFGKSSRDVNLAEAALLAGLLKAPSRLSPARSPKRAERRAQVVLGAMHRTGFISNSEAATALSMPTTHAKSYWTGAENYVADWIMTDIKHLVGEIDSDIIVETTLDLGLQQSGEKAIRKALDDKGKAMKVSQGALVSLDGTGAIRAMVGGRDYATSQFNRAREAKRQPGSAFKPFVYLAALEIGHTPSSIRQDAPVRIGKWRPKNYDNKYRGAVTLKTALSKSLNTIAAQLVMEVGPKNVVRLAHRLGISSPLNANASIALGTSEVSLLELTSAYAPFANGGYLARPYVIKRITALNGKVLYQRKSGDSQRVVGSIQLGQMNAMMIDVVNNGTGRAARINGWQVAGKTGTSQAFRDGWFIGYTSNLVTGVWFGNDDGSPTKKVTGGSLPARAWARFMQSAHDGVPVGDLPGNNQNIVVLPERIAVPTPRPAYSSALTRYASSGNGRPVPPANIGETRKTARKKTILDLIFGG
jgi:penicillin-binding protein 1A